MRQTLPEKLETGRVRTGAFATDASYGGYGHFKLTGPCGADLFIIASAAHDSDPDAAGWEHVSVTVRCGKSTRTPNWQEMCFVKDLFWGDEETVIQFHPPRSQYVNNHPHCLHLWRSKRVKFPLPPSHLVGWRDTSA